MRDNLNGLWRAALDEIRKRVGGQRFNLWFSNTRLLALNDEEVEIGVPNPFIRGWLEDNFVQDIVAGIECAAGVQPRIRFKVDGQLFEEVRKVQKRLDAPTSSARPVRQTEKDEPQEPVRPDVTLRDFVVGSSNQLAHAMAMEVIRSRGRCFNPLFIHGPVGVGKTHILQGIYNAFRRQARAGIRALYVSAEEYTNDFIRAIMKRQFDSFRRKYRNINILLIDDVHFLARKKATEEEFLHTFNDLSGMNGCIIMASDSHPKMIARLKASLVSRFVSGMVVKLEEPDLDTRAAIVCKRLRKDFAVVPEDVVHYVAESCPCNVRELEGALTALVAFARVADRPLSLPVAEEALRSLSHDRSRSITLREIEEAVCKQFCVSKTDLRSKRRTRAISFPRQICMHLGRQLTSCSFQEIGDHFGGKNHTTVRSADSKMAREVQDNSQLRNLLVSLTAELGR